MLKIGFDVDGVLANFVEASEKVIIQMTGKNLFPQYEGERGPATWNWPVYYGYTQEEMDAAFKRIAEKPGFWTGLNPLSGAKELADAWHALYFDADVYFVTNRSGPAAKTETEWWLEQQGIQRPTVLISKAKGAVAAALKLDAYIDDNFDNALDVRAASPNTKNFLLVRQYNEQFWNEETNIISPYDDPAGITRIHSVSEFIRRVDANL